MQSDLLNMKMEMPAENEAVEPKTTVEFGAELNDLRRRVINGEEVTKDELRAALVTLRETFGKRVTKAPATKGAKKPAKTSKQMSEEEAQALLDNLSIPGL